MDGASCDLKVYVRDYSIFFPFDAPGKPGASRCLLGRSCEVFFLFCLIICKEIRYVEETHAAFDVLQVEECDFRSNQVYRVVQCRINMTMGLYYSQSDKESGRLQNLPLPDAFADWQL